MTGIRGKSIHTRAAVRAIALANLLTIACAACGESSEGAAAKSGRGPLVGAFDEIASCAETVYRGPETALYSNRPYHTAERVDAATGLVFCQGARHGTNVWIVEISQPTTLLAFGNDAFGLERRGWTASEETIFVAAAGVPLNRLYTKHFSPGRYVVRQGFTATAPIVLWDGAAVRLAR